MGQMDKRHAIQAEIGNEHAATPTKVKLTLDKMDSVLNHLPVSLRAAGVSLCTAVSKTADCLDCLESGLVSEAQSLLFDVEEQMDLVVKASAERVSVEGGEQELALKLLRMSALAEGNALSLLARVFEETRDDAQFRQNLGRAKYQFLQAVNGILTFKEAPPGR